MNLGDSRFGYAEESSDFLKTHSFEIVEMEYQPVSFRKEIQFLPEHCSHAFSRQRAQGIPFG